MNQQYMKKDILQMDLEDLERQIESELHSLQSFEQNMTSRSGCSQNMVRQQSISSLNQITSKKTPPISSSGSNAQSILQPKSQNTFSEALNRQKSSSQLKQHGQNNQNKIVELSHQQKEKNKNLFTIEDLQREEAKKTVRRRSKSPLGQKNNIPSRVVPRKNDYKNDKENYIPSTAFSSGRTVASSVRSSENHSSGQNSNYQKGNLKQQQPQQQFTQQQPNNSNAKSQQQRLQQQSQQIRQNIFDLIQNDKFDSAETNFNNNGQYEQDYNQENAFSNPSNQETHWMHQQQQQQQQQGNSFFNNFQDERENFNFINYSREDDDINKLLAAKIPQSQKNSSAFNTQESGSTARGNKKSSYHTQESASSGQTLKRSQSNLNCASSRYSQVRSSQNSAATANSQSQAKNKSSQYVDEKCTFKPMLSKKSMELAQKMEDPRVRLTQPKNEEKLNKLRSSIESQYSYRPSINRNKLYDNFQQESMFNYSDEENEDERDGYYGNNYDNDFSLKRSSNIRQSSSSSHSSKVPRWQSLYEQHKVYQMDKEIKMIQKEKEEQEDPELTFQPRLFRSKESNYMYGDSEFDINYRCQIWNQKRQEKLKKVSEQFENRDLIGCTFQPNMSSINSNSGAHNQSSTSTNMNQNKSQNMTNQHDFSQQITEFNKKGIIEYFERVDAAKKKKQETEQIQNKNTGQNWQNKITIPKEFSFMKKESSGQRSTSNLRNSRNNDSTQNRDRSKSPTNTNQNKIMLFYKTRSLSSNNLCQIESDENQIYQEVSNSINNWDKVKQNMHRHIHQIDL